MKTSIIIPTYNNEDYTIRCMESIGNYTKDYIILWVDDASSKESVEKVQRFLVESLIPYELIGKDENSGFAQSVNLGLARALELESKYIVIQNNDTEVYENWLERMIEVADLGQRIGAVGPVTSPCESWQSVNNLRNEFDQFSNLPRYENNPSEYAKQVAKLYPNKHMMVYKRLAFFSVLFRAEVVRQLGMLSEEYGIGFGEDDDYMLRLKQHGYTGALAEDVFVFHNHNTTFKNKFSDAEIKEMREHNRDILYRKFKKGRFRPKDIDQVWDLEEVIDYAKWMEKVLQKKNDLLEKKEKYLQEKLVQLLDKNEQLREKRDLITEKNGKIGELNYHLKKMEEQSSLLKEQLRQKGQQVEELLGKSKKQVDNLAGLQKQLDAVQQSLSWRLTVPLRKISALLKRGSERK